MSKQTIGGIHNVLDGLLSPNHQPDESPKLKIAKPAEKHHAKITEPDAVQILSNATGARRGRPLGKYSISSTPKQKVTLLLTTNLIAAYRDWSWDARCPLSALVQQAMEDYQKHYQTSSTF